MVALQLQFDNSSLGQPQAVTPDTTTTSATTDAGSQAKLLLLNAADPARASLQDFIARGFADAYGAEVRNFMPDLLAVSARGEWQAVLGIRSGQNQSLFVEQYLDADICSILQSVGINTQRDEVVEIGNLFSANRQYTLLLFVVLAYALHQLGYRQLVCCATEQVQALLQRHGLELTYLADGDASRLGEAANSWGSYYQSHPKVCALDLTQAMALIAQSPRLLALPRQFWPALHATVSGLSLEQAGAPVPSPETVQLHKVPALITAAKARQFAESGVCV